MGDQEGKTKNPYFPWSPEETKTLLCLLVNGVNQNWTDASDSEEKTQELDLLRFSSGFGWDKDTNKFTAPNEVWNEYFQGHNKDKHLRDDTFEDFEDLEKIYGQNIARGNNAVGLGDTTNARTYIARDNEWEYQEGCTPQRMGDDENDDDDNGDDDDGVEQASSLRRSNVIKKLPVRKRARTDVYNMEKNSGEISWNNQLDFHMKAGFMSMTREERFRWIKRSVRKP
ncbi:hypothetical protein N665_0218s0054 [Sinapis alba]|nr:hypothetical protein N665_0218s0054 [Sinapis alba]